MGWESDEPVSEASGRFHTSCGVPSGLWASRFAQGEPGPGLIACSSLSPSTSDILNYYFLCSQEVSNPFQQVRTVGERHGGPEGRLMWSLKGTRRATKDSRVPREEEGAEARSCVV